MSLVPGRHRGIAPLIRDARFVPLPMAGHAPLSDCPGRIVALVREVAGKALARAAAVKSATASLLAGSDAPTAGDHRAAV
jgi:hypothetical protein